MSNSKGDMFDYVETTLQPMAKDECSKMYANWSKDYEKDIADCKYTAYRGVADGLLALNIPKDAKILDCGAGTGLLGESLAKCGFTNLDALDGCAGMLEEAKKKNIYHNITVAYVDPESALPIDDESYDVLTMVGVFCPGHFPMKVDTFKQLLRVVKKGGLMTWGMANPDRYAERDASYADKAFDKIIQLLVDEKVIKVLDGHPKKYAEYFKNEDGFFWAVQKL